eukprot:Gb_37393 [translate_table: standard]
MEQLGGANDGVIGMPISVSYGHMAAPIHESNVKALSNSIVTVDNGSTASEEIRPHDQSVKKTVRYRECLKNHAASIGGHANDGCGEFMPSGDEGTLEALKCAACGCHRNFHRREVNGEPPCYYCYSSNNNINNPPGLDMSRKRALIPPPHMPLALPSSPHANISRSHPQMIMALNSGLRDEDHDHMGSTMYIPAMKKRFRTKFTQDQKDKMCAFAEKLGWRIQKHDDVAVQQFCMEVGVKRHVLKVWMHNNKHTLAKKP